MKSAPGVIFAVKLQMAVIFVLHEAALLHFKYLYHSSTSGFCTAKYLYLSVVASESGWKSPARHQSAHA